MGGDGGVHGGNMIDEPTEDGYNPHQGPSTTGGGYIPPPPGIDDGSEGASSGTDFL